MDQATSVCQFYHHVLCAILGRHPARSPLADRPVRDPLCFWPLYPRHLLHPHLSNLRARPYPNQPQGQVGSVPRGMGRSHRDTDTLQQARRRGGYARSVRRIPGILCCLCAVPRLDHLVWFLWDGRSARACHHWYAPQGHGDGTYWRCCSHRSRGGWGY